MARIRYPRILFYAVNGLGLGHVTRLMAIANALREQSPEAEIVFFTSSEAEDVLYREGFAAFKVPSRTVRAATSIRPATYARMLHTVTLNMMASFHPHILVVDTFPAGALQELLPVLRWDSRRVFVFREQRPEAATSALTQGTLQLYDLAIIPHREGEADIPLPEGLERRWVGPIILRDREHTRGRQEARALLGLPPDGPVLYVTFGGGGDPDMDRSLGAVIDALDPATGADVPATHLAVAVAPLFRGRISARPWVTPVSYYPMAELYPAFDAAISAAGYNSTNELLHHGVPTAFVPFPRQVDDQEARVAQVTGLGAGLSLDVSDPSAIRSTVRQLLAMAGPADMARAARAHVPDSGAGRAAEAILDLLG